MSASHRKCEKITEKLGKSLKNSVSGPFSQCRLSLSCFLKEFFSPHYSGAKRPPKMNPRMKGQMKIFHVGSHQFRESLRELLRELWFSHCSSRETPFREWDFPFRELFFELRELLREHPGTLPELREWPFRSESVFPEIGGARRLLIYVCHFWESETVEANRVAAMNPPIDDTDPIRKFSSDPGSHTHLQNPAEFSSKGVADTEFQYRPHIVDTVSYGHDCGRRFCGHHFRDLYFQGALKGTNLRGQTKPKRRVSLIFADSRPFLENTASIWETQIFAEDR